MRCDPVDRNATTSAHGCSAICGCGSRRAFLRSAAAFGASVALPAPAVWAQGGSAPPPAPAAKPHRIDVHHHFFPPFLMEAWQKANIRSAPPVQRWTLAGTLEQMDRGGVATAILSIASGGLNLPELSAEENRRMTRMVNDYAAKARADHSGRFGLFAFMPLPDIDGTLKEIEYALDVLKADGIGLSTSYGNKFLGDPAFKPVLDELNRRKAIVYVHPNRPDCCDTIIPYVPGSFTEYPQDTNRTVSSLLFSGGFTRTRDIRWIFSHGGAAVPLLAGRMNSLAKFQIRNAAELYPDGIDFELKRLYYETANAAYAPNLAALLKFVDISQVMFGTDYPYVSVVENVGDLLKAGLTEAQLKAIDNENALRLMPRLKG
jgi:predicted TIM-barrel fold metal-dependent hydrolase